MWNVCGSEIRHSHVRVKIVVTSRSRNRPTPLLARKVERIASVLEEHMGKPVQPRRKSAPLDSLIATLLSQNTNDRNSHRAWLHLKREYPSWEAVADAPTRMIAKTIEVGGLKNQKAKRIKLILERIRREVGRYDLGFLKTKSNEEAMQYLSSMKGVGMKTAACVLVFSLGREVFPVDTHIHRLCNRLGLVQTTNAEQTFNAISTVIPNGSAYSIHVNLIRFGRKTCRSNNPLCSTCPLFDECVYPDKVSHAAMAARPSGRSKRDVDFIILNHVS